MLTSAPAYPEVSTSRPLFGPAEAVDAPIGEKGGILSTFVYCSRAGQSPRVKWVVRNVDTGSTKRFHWRGAYPGMAFPRVPVGTYKVTTTATCGGSRRVYREVLDVEQKTYRRTMSHREFRAVRRGMTRAEVRETVGFDGDAAGRYGGHIYRTYDGMPFWSYSLITFRGGAVVEKAWDVDHD